MMEEQRHGSRNIDGSHIDLQVGSRGRKAQRHTETSKLGPGGVAMDLYPDLYVGGRETES